MGGYLSAGTDTGIVARMLAQGLTGDMTPDEKDFVEFRLMFKSSATMQQFYLLLEHLASADGALGSPVEALQVRYCSARTNYPLEYKF